MTTHSQPSETASTPFLLAGIHDGAESPQAATPGGPGEQLSLFGDNAPASPPAGIVWLAFTGDTDIESAQLRFYTRYGQLPAQVFHGLGGLLLAGPVPSDLPEVLL